MAGAFCACEPFHTNAPVGHRLRDDVLCRAVIPVRFLCALDQIAISSARSLPEVVEQAIAEYCESRGVNPASL